MSDDKREEIPEWINNQFLEEALQNGLSNPDLRVASSEVSRATAPGDNYMSVIYRAKVQVETSGRSETKSYILKVEPQAQVLNKFVKDFKVFEMEVSVLRDVLPAMHKLLQDALGEDFSPFSAKYIYSRYGDPEIVVIMEDLKDQHFVMTERTSGLDLNHCLLVMKKLAQFHAASVVLHEKNPELLKRFMDPWILKMMDSEFKDVFSFTLKTLAGNLETESKELGRFSKKIYALSECGMEKWILGRVRNENELNVLSHGDLWVNNMMFQYSKETNNVADVRFVDYQLTYWTSPAADLQYFLNSSPTDDVIKNQQILLEEYHKVLGETLVSLGYKHLKPSLEQIIRQFESRGEFGLLSVLSIRNAVLIDKDNVPDMDKLVKENKSMPFSKMYLKSLEFQLPMFEEKGWL